MNQITSFLDGSNVYGSEMSTSRSLRLGRRGRLRVTRIESEDLLPLAPEECADFSKHHYCFAAGLYRWDCSIFSRKCSKTKGVTIKKFEARKVRSSVCNSN